MLLILQNFFLTIFRNRCFSTTQIYYLTFSHRSTYVVSWWCLVAHYLYQNILQLCVARCRCWQSETHLRVGVSGENFKNFSVTSQKFQINNYIQNNQTFNKNFSGVAVVVGVWWCVMYSFKYFSCVYTMYVYMYALYTLNIHILCTFSGVLCTNTVYYTLYTGLFYSEILCGKSTFGKTSYIHLIFLI